MKVMTDALWIRNGEVGPQPTASTAEMRATVYDQAESASELRAFRKVAAVTGVELAEATLAGLRAGHIILTYTALRGLIERTAHAFATAAKLKKIKDAHVDGPLAPVLELSETIHKALYATQREWTKLVKSDFRKTSVKDVQYVKKPNVANAFSDNILHPSPRCDDDGDATADQIGYRSRQAIDLVLRPAVFDRYVPALDEA
jgi:hypothetical protein